MRHFDIFLILPIRKILGTCSKCLIRTAIDSHCKFLLFYFSIPGGTDIVACFLGQNWKTPVYSGEVQQFQLGCCMKCFNLEGKKG